MEMIIFVTDVIEKFSLFPKITEENFFSDIDSTIHKFYLCEECHEVILRNYDRRKFDIITKNIDRLIKMNNFVDA
jgi:NAD-dependent SIR2 family protein deacetylase